MKLNFIDWLSVNIILTALTSLFFSNVYMYVHISQIVFYTIQEQDKNN